MLEEFIYFKQPVKFNYIYDNCIFDLSMINLVDIDGSYNNLLLPNNKKLDKLLKKNNYYSETVLNIDNTENDKILSPIGMVSRKIFVLSGYKDIKTMFKYELANRTILYVNSGNILVRIMLPTNLSNETAIVNYDNLLYIVDYDIWKNINNYDILEIELAPHEALYIPSYWPYSIKFNNKSKIIQTNYYTAMNLVSITPVLFTKYLEKLNK